MTLRKTTAVAAIMGFALMVSACAENNEKNSVQYKNSKEKFERPASLLK